MKKNIFITNSTVIDKLILGDRYFKLKVKVSKKCFDQAMPGQFAHVLCSKEILKRKSRSFTDYYELKNYVRSNSDSLIDSRILLRRPLCIHDAYEEEENGKTIHIFELLVRIKGGGTSILSRLEKGSRLNFLAPLGRPFNYKKSVREKNKVIIVSGGMGIAPVAFLSRRLIESGTYPVMFYGFEEYFSLREGSTMTTDLSRMSRGLTISSNTMHEEGYNKGFVTDALAKHLKKLKKDELSKTDIYSCGPHPMLKRVKEIAEEYGVNCEISMEERMACGIGACAVCVCKSPKDNGFEYKRVCLDGPVFNSKEILFE